MTDKIKNAVVAVVAAVMIPCYRGKNIDGREQWGEIEIPRNILGTWQSVENIEKLGIEYIPSFAHKSAQTVFVHPKLGFIGRDTYNRIGNLDIDVSKAKELVRRWSALTTISGQLCNPRCEFPKIRLEAKMLQWGFTIAELRSYAASVHKLAALNVRLESFGL